jgi:hypothetical protein
VLVEVFKICAEEVRWVETFGEAALLRIVLEEVDIQPEFIPCERWREPERAFLESTKQGCETLKVFFFK